MHLCVHRWLHGVWLAAVLVLERVCVALPLLVKGIVRFRQAQVRLLLGQLYIKENPAFQRKEMRDYLLTDGGYHVII